MFRWFVGLAIDDPVWDATVFSKNRDRLLEGAIAARFLATVLAQPRVTKLMSSEHFSVDGALIEAWASMKSFKPKDGSGDEPPSGSGRNAEVDFKGRKRCNETRLDHRPGSKALPQGRWPGGETRFPRTRLDGEPLLPDRQRLPHSG